MYLFFSAVVRPYPNAWFGQGTGLPIFLDNVNCAGTESNLLSCSYSTPSGDTHSEDASVRCYAESDLSMLKLKTCHTVRMFVFSKMNSSLCDHGSFCSHHYFALVP